MKLLCGNTLAPWLRGTVVGCEVFHRNYKNKSWRAVETAKNGKRVSDGEREAAASCFPLPAA